MIRRGTLNWSLDADTQHAGDPRQFHQVMGRPMQFDPILPPTRVKAMTAQDYWQGLILTDYFDRCLAEVPDKAAVVDFNSTAQTETRLTYRELAARIERIAAGLIGLGIEKDDVVSCQLPNWWQFTALTVACSRIGAVINPLMPIFRERELKFMLGLAESKVLIIPREFRGFDYVVMARGIRSELPSLHHLLIIGGEGSESFEHVLLHQRGRADEDATDRFKARRPTADNVTELLYTL